MEQQRRLPVGAEVLPGGGVHFRVWTPRRKKVSVVIEAASEPLAAPGSRSVELSREPGGYFSGVDQAAGDGTLYRFKLDDDEKLYPDPASRFQPEGPNGPSQVIDPGKFIWTDREWRGLSIEGQVIYEMHAGTFTKEGTWRADGRACGACRRGDNAHRSHART
jgi:maltooligosyltrehalose trehalohydrolase